MADETYGGKRRGETERWGGRPRQRGGYEDEPYRQGSRQREYYGGGVEPRFGREGGRFGPDDELEQSWREGGYERGQRYAGEGRETSGGWQRGGFGGAYGGSDRGAEEYGRRGGSWGEGRRSEGWSGEGRDYGRGGGGSMFGRYRDDEFGGEIGWGGDEGYGRGRGMAGGGERWGRESGGAGHRGKGPRGYQRSDDRIREDISDRLSDDDNIDASNLEIRVENGQVTLTGEVDSKFAKRRAEDIAEEVSGVSDVQNNLRLRRETSAAAGRQQGSWPSIAAQPLQQAARVESSTQQSGFGGGGQQAGVQPEGSGGQHGDTSRK
jgi:hypothetical protein